MALRGAVSASSGSLAAKAQARLQALRLSGADSVVPTLFPGKPVPEAWVSLIAGIRRAAGVQPASPPWSEFPTEEALTRSWAPG